MPVEDLRSGAVIEIAELSEEFKQRARLTVARNATGPADGLQLLRMLGLDEVPR
ncbi:hypothetical protein [Nocardia thailandica]|uniref:hypothetical protein n=1 Tax=Nocardia thailandica TaxID=257275 RepID=UPI0002DB56F1|nr:hypothetical protein [Nocardia thailandica]